MTDTDLAAEALREVQAGAAHLTEVAILDVPRQMAVPAGAPNDFTQILAIRLWAVVKLVVCIGL